EKAEGETTAEVTLYAATDGSEPLRVTIAWTDPAATVPDAALNARTKMLVNDLDLRVTSISDPNDVYLPWILDVASPTLAATTGDNITDNVEQVLLAAPGQDAYKITITHKDTLQNDKQDFSLIITGALAIGDSLAPLASPQVATVYEGSTLDIAVRLVAPPAADDYVLTVGHIGGDNGISIQSPASGTLTFSPTTWATPQYIRLAAATDTNVCDETTTIRITPPVASGLPSTDITAIAADTDVDLIVTGLSLSLDEGESGSIQVSLSGEPCGTTLAKVVKTSGPTNIDLSTAGTLTFSAANWDVPQTITVTANQDDTDFTDGHATFDIILDTAAKVTKTLNVFDTDDDELQVVTNVENITVPEGGEVSVNVSLSASPPTPVEIRIQKQSGDTDLTIVSGVALSFDSSNYWQGQPVVFAAADDADRLDGTAIFRASFVGSSSDYQDLTVTEEDDDKLQFVLDPLTLDVPEWESAQFGIKLNGACDSDVPVTVTWLSGDRDITLVGPTLLTFTNANWDTLQYVTVSTAGDPDELENTAQIQISADDIPTATIVVSEKERVSYTRPSSPTTPSPSNLVTGVPLNVTLRWVGSPIAQEYYVYLATSMVPSNSDLFGTTSTNQMSVTGLQPGTKYSWRVVAKNTRGVSASPTWTFTTTASTSSGDTTDPNSAVTDPNDTVTDPNDTVTDPNDSTSGNDPNESDDTGTPVAPVPCGLPLFTAMLVGLAGRAVWRRRA
ncbi:MAG: fibronectin type III domain-containing protein, partial [Phycisphaerae bacterium]|nr:fibronectin type III domain-containing protein [Phycisphaerae bacterium]